MKTSYSSISLQWQEGFDGGWTQSYQVSLNETLTKETNQTEITLNRMSH